MSEWNQYRLSKASASIVHFPESFMESINERIAQERHKHDCLSVIYAMGFDAEFAERIYLFSVKWGQDPVEVATYTMQGKLKFEDFIKDQSSFENWVKSVVYPSFTKE